MSDPEDDSIIVEVEIVSAFPKLSPGGFIEDKSGEACLRQPDTVELLTDGNFRVTREWVRPLHEPFDLRFYEYRPSTINHQPSTLNQIDHS